MVRSEVLLGLVVAALVSLPAVAQNSAWQSDVAVDIPDWPDDLVLGPGDEWNLTMRVRFTIEGGGCDQDEDPPASEQRLRAGIYQEDSSEGYYVKSRSADPPIHAEVGQTTFVFPASCGDHVANATLRLWGSLNRSKYPETPYPSERRFQMRLAADYDGESGANGPFFDPNDPVISPSWNRSASEGLKQNVSAPASSLSSAGGRSAGATALLPWLLPLVLVAFAAGYGTRYVSERDDEEMRLLEGETPVDEVEPPRLEPGSLFLNKYRVERELGQGAFGVTFLATHLDLDRKVAIKQLHPGVARSEEARARFEQEARILASIDHPNIVRVYDVERVGGRWYLLMEYLEGGSLADRVERGAIDLEEAADLADDILEGLAHAHDRGIVHRDLKPSNVLLDADGTATIADFGVARSETADRTTLAGDGDEPLGTPAYMAPEQLEGTDVDERTDLYAVAVTVYRLVTGRHPLGSLPSSPVELRRRILEERPALPVTDLPEAFNAWLETGLAKDPDDRFASAEEMAEALHEAVEGDR